MCLSLFPIVSSSPPYLFFSLPEIICVRLPFVKHRMLTGACLAHMGHIHPTIGDTAHVQTQHRKKTHKKTHKRHRKDTEKDAQETQVRGKRHGEMHAVVWVGTHEQLQVTPETWRQTHNTRSGRVRMTARKQRTSHHIE